MGEFERLHNNSSLPTPIIDISFGMLIPFILQISEICIVKLSSQANIATGFSNEMSQFSNCKRSYAV